MDIVIKKYFDKNTILVCLGDYVDRPMKEGDSVWTVLKLFQLKQKYPERVFLLRGNHEFAEVNGSYGFREDVLQFYDADVWDRFNDVFELMPLVVRTSNGVLLLHGGLPDVSSVDELKSLPKAGSSEENKFVDQIVWNDCLPRRTALLIVADRGIPNTFTYGQEFFDKQMKLLNCNVLIRGHQYIMKGVIFDGKCVTLHTTKIYAGFPREISKYYRFFFPPLPGRTIAIIPPKPIRWAEDLELVNLDD